MGTLDEIEAGEKVEAIRRIPRMTHARAALAAALAMTQPRSYDYGAPPSARQPKCADPKKKAKRKMQAASRRRNRNR